MSTELSETVLDEAASRGETLIIHDLLRLIERHDTGPGVPEDRLDAYISALGDSGFDEAALRSGLSDQLSESDEWVDESTVYRLDGEISGFPPRWHEELDGEQDLSRYVATMSANVEGGSAGYDFGGRGEGVPKKLLADTAIIFGGYTYEYALEELSRYRDEGLLTADADMHPSARIQLTEAGAERLDIDPESAVSVETDPVEERKKDPRIDE